MEVHLAAAPGRWTVLRPGFFQQNCQDAYSRDIRDDDRLYVPAGRGKVAFVDLHDVADVAALAFEHPEDHAGRAWTLTGPDAIGFQQLAGSLTAALGRPIRYAPASVLGYVCHLRARGLPWAQAVVQTVLHLGLRFGQAEAVDPTLASLLRRPGRSIDTYLGENANRWASQNQETRA